MSEFKIKAGYIRYDTNFITYDTSGFVTSDCNSIVFINYGIAQCLIDFGKRCLVIDLANKFRALNFCFVGSQFLWQIYFCQIVRRYFLKTTRYLN